VLKVLIDTQALGYVVARHLVAERLTVPVCWNKTYQSVTLGDYWFVGPTVGMKGLEACGYLKNGDIISSPLGAILPMTFPRS
jgi:hypothetical protein